MLVILATNEHIPSCEPMAILHLSPATQCLARFDHKMKNSAGGIPSPITVAFKILVKYFRNQDIKH